VKCKTDTDGTQHDGPDAEHLDRVRPCEARGPRAASRVSVRDGRRRRVQLRKRLSQLRQAFLVRGVRRAGLLEELPCFGRQVAHRLALCRAVSAALSSRRPRRNRE
jgi:hypothetical protein